MKRPTVDNARRARKTKTDFRADRSRLRSPEIDAEPARSPLDALARGLVTIGDRYRSRPRLRVL